MLRCGKSFLEDGMTIEKLIDYLNKNGHSVTTNSTILFYYFYTVFFSKGTSEYPPHHSEKFYLKPECYMQLLEYDNLQEARKEAKETRLYTIIAILLSLASFIVSIFN